MTCIYRCRSTNPCEALERPRTVPVVPKGMSADQIQRLLAVIPDTKTGLRDRAIVLTLTFTGRRRAEVMGLRAGNLILDGEIDKQSHGAKRVRVIASLNDHRLSKRETIWTERRVYRSTQNIGCGRANNT
jgi:site-specific recombinase XerC